MKQGEGDLILYFIAHVARCVLRSSHGINGRLYLFLPVLTTDRPVSVCDQFPECIDDLVTCSGGTREGGRRGL